MGDVHSISGTSQQYRQAGRHRCIHEITDLSNEELRLFEFGHKIKKAEWCHLDGPCLGNEDGQRARQNKEVWVAEATINSHMKKVGFFSARPQNSLQQANNGDSEECGLAEVLQIHGVAPAPGSISQTTTFQP